MPSCNSYRLTWVSLTLEEGYLLTATPPDLERGMASLDPPAPTQPPLLGRGLLLPYTQSKKAQPDTQFSSVQLLSHVQLFATP